MIGTLMSAVVSVLGSVIALAPPSPVGDSPPPTPPEPGNELPERRLAEFSFAMYLTIELELDPGDFTCSEPQVEGDVSEITCFALIDESRVIVAVTNSSEGTGVYDWTVISDHVVGEASTTTTTTTTSSSTPPPTSTSTPTSTPTTNLSDTSILSYGEEINRGAEPFKADVIRLAEGTITAVPAYGWDATSTTITLEVTLDPTQSYTTDQLDRAAWILAQVVKYHWVRGEPFRLDGATLRPRLILVVNAAQYVSDFDLMVRVADQLITNTDWADAARKT